MRQRCSARATQTRFAVTLSCFALALLPACQRHDPDSPFRRYTGQLELALATDRPIIVQHPAPRMRPEATRLRRPIPTSAIDNLDFMRLSGCAVQANIGKRQTRLGQFAKPSQRLLLELEYLRLAPDCIQDLRDNNRHILAATLDSAWREKQAQLPALIFNATLASDEYRAFWLASASPGGFPRSSSQATSAAMNAINDQTRRWLSHDYRASDTQFELWLSTVAGGDGGAQLQAWSQQADWLTSATILLNNRLASGPVCAEQTTKGTTLRRLPIAQAYFNANVMPLTLHSKQHFEQTVAPITALESQLHTALSPHYHVWVSHRTQLTQRLANTPAQHLTRLRDFQNTCVAR